MQVPIGTTGWYLCGWEDDPDFDCEELTGREALAEQWLNQFCSDVFAVRTLGRLLGATHPWSSDEQVLADTAWRLSSRFWKARRAALDPIPVSGPVTQAAAPFPIEERRPPPSSSPVSDPPVFPGDIDPEAIAQAKKEAAALGIPFCEECLRAQLAGH